MDAIPFTNPFRYTPHPLVREAAEAVIREIDGSEELSSMFAEGKMMGVLIVKDQEDNLLTLKGFSGTVGGKARIDGFVPPIFDLTCPGGYYREKEAEISEINSRTSSLIKDVLTPAAASLRALQECRNKELASLREIKKDAATISESQFANGEIKRAKDRWKGIISEKEAELQEIQERINSLKKLRAQMSDHLQRWIFEQYIVHNAEGEKSSILDIFTNQGLMPPGGTGDCAAPKLLNHAFMNGLKPVAMGEFWYGKSPDTAIRTHGHFYPSCTSKCGPLLAYMLRGLETAEVWGEKTESLPTSLGPSRSQGHGRPWFFHPTPPPSGSTSDSAPEAEIVYEDEDIIAVSKSSGMPSVPGLDGRESLQEWLQNKLGISIFPVHRLDMDTSGIIVYAKTREAETNLKKQFEEHSVRKTYMARLCPADTHRFAAGTPELKAGDKGSIGLPLNPDYDERPRQRVDHAQGKPSLTEYEVISVNEDGTTDILFHPHTGRTHQLRVHSAHLLGLGRPILGDLLYGGYAAHAKDLRAANLCLHALRITFRHPSSGEDITLQV